MICNEVGKGVEENGIFYSVGQKVIGCDCEYEGLNGRITEIRTGSDKETENETTDIYCSFDVPKDVVAVKKLEAMFSDLYDEKKNIEDIALDMVIMAPDMIRGAE